jgi:hypothetical protein
MGGQSGVQRLKLLENMKMLKSAMPQRQRIFMSTTLLLHGTGIREHGITKIVLQHQEDGYIRTLNQQFSWINIRGRRDKMTLTIGCKYKKSDFGISGIVNRWSEITVFGELFTFFSVDSKYKDSIQPDGFVYECRCSCSLIPKGIKTSLRPHVFVRMKVGEGYTYLGKGLYEAYYDDNRNKIFLKGANE